MNFYGLGLLTTVTWIASVLWAEGGTTFGDWMFFQDRLTPRIGWSQLDTYILGGEQLGGLAMSCKGCIGAGSF